MNTTPHQHQDVHTIRPMTQAEADEWLLVELMGDEYQHDAIAGAFSDDESTEDMG
jgi:hypothetical protein